MRKQTLFTSDFPARIGLLLYLQRPQKKSIPQKWSKKPKPPDANISIFGGGGGGGWSFFCPFKNKSKLLVYAIYVKICKNGQRFRYSRYNWKYQPHLVHFILIFMNTLGKVSAIIYCLISCTVHALFRMVSVVLVGKLIWMNRIFFFRKMNKLCMVYNLHTY